MKKRICALLIATAGLFALTGCNNGEKEHTHSIVGYKEYSSPTCTEIGVIYTYCHDCKEIIIKATPALGHTFDKLKKSETNETTHIYECSACNVAKQEPHVYYNNLCTVCGYIKGKN